MKAAHRQGLGQFFTVYLSSLGNRVLYPRSWTGSELPAPSGHWQDLCKQEYEIQEMLTTQKTYQSFSTQDDIVLPWSSFAFH